MTLHALDPMPMDAGIIHAVGALAAAGIETFESCEGGEGHALPEPTVRFHGGSGEGYRALAAALELGLPVRQLRRSWDVIDGVPTGPWWELTFAPTMTAAGEQLKQEVATFESHREELLGKALNKYVLIHETKVVGTYDTESDAINEGYRQFGNVPFLVKRVSPVDEPANYLSGLVTI